MQQSRPPLHVVDTKRLRSNLASLCRAAEAGETVIILSRHRPVAALVGPPPDRVGGALTLYLMTHAPDYKRTDGQGYRLEEVSNVREWMADALRWIASGRYAAVGLTRRGYPPRWVASLVPPGRAIRLALAYQPRELAEGLLALAT